MNISSALRRITITSVYLDVICVLPLAVLAPHLFRPPTSSLKPPIVYFAMYHLIKWLKWFFWSRGGTHLTKPGWSKPHTQSNPTNLALFRRKITLYRFNQGAHTIAGDLKWQQGAEPPEPPHFNHSLCLRVCNGRVGGVCLCVCGSVTTITRNCVYRMILTKLGL